MINRDWEGMQLDKDIITYGNKAYSPSNCCFIAGTLNSLLNNCAASRGAYPQGVSWDKQMRKYRAGMRINRRQIFLGLHSTPEEASAAYIKAKIVIILKAANEQADPTIANGLRIHAELLKRNA
jgi:hypothetical protein